MNNPSNSSKCPNCLVLRSDNQKYCNNCGQKTRKSIPSLKELLEEIFSMIFNFDTQIYQTLKNSLIPGKLTSDFFDGKRKRYYQPFRFFFICSILFFWTLSLIGVQDIIKLNSGDEQLGQTMRISNVKLKLDSLRDNIEHKFEDKLMINAVFDSIQIELVSDLPDSITIPTFSNQKIRVSSLEFMGLSAEKVISKYNIKNFYQKISITQFFKIGKNANQFGWFLLGKIIWVLLVLLPFFAFIMKGLFFKPKRYFVEHLVFLFHTHAFLFIISSISLFLSIYIDSDMITIVPIILMFVYVILALKQYYQQSWLKTSFKGIVGLFIYTSLSGLFFFAMLLISFALY